MESCKYRLPCGHCDKFDEPCSILEKKIEMDLEEEVLREKQAKCMHTWVWIKTTYGDYPYPHEEKTFECAKCKLKKYDYKSLSEV